jgi:hypothetical protein
MDTPSSGNLELLTGTARAAARLMIGTRTMFMECKPPNTPSGFHHCDASLPNLAISSAFTVEEDVLLLLHLAKDRAVQAKQGLRVRNAIPGHLQCRNS